MIMKLDIYLNEGVIADEKTPQTDYPCLLDPRYTFFITHSQSSVPYNICKLTRRKNGGPRKELTSVKPIELAT